MTYFLLGLLILTAFLIYIGINEIKRTNFFLNILLNNFEEGKNIQENILSDLKIINGRISNLDEEIRKNIQKQMDTIFEIKRSSEKMITRDGLADELSIILLTISEKFDSVERTLTKVRLRLEFTDEEIKSDVILNLIDKN
ncbi:MAG TPA: hypothetical protein VK959_00205 [Methylophilaceae bacterium]|nr:hypothetical protein [Methylophilaceae bacterium]